MLFDRPIPSDSEVFTVEMACYKLTVVAVVARNPVEAELKVRQGKGVTLTIVEDTVEYNVMDGGGNAVLKGETSEEN